MGAGDGTLELVVEAEKPVLPLDSDVKLPSIPALTILKSTNVNSAVTSIQVKMKLYEIGKRHMRIFYMV